MGVAFLRERFGKGQDIGLGDNGLQFFCFFLQVAYDIDSYVRIYVLGSNSNSNCLYAVSTLLTELTEGVAWVEWIQFVH